MNHLVPPLIAAMPLLAQAPIPATPVGQMLQAYLEIINSGEASRTQSPNRCGESPAGGWNSRKETGRNR